MVLISKDRVHIKGSMAECICDFGILSATMEKRFNLTLDELKQILTIAHEDLESVDHKSQEAETRTISIVFKRGRDIFNL